MAERVLRDYAELAADELVRRSTAQIGYYGYFAYLRAFAAAGSEDPLAAPTEPESLRPRGAPADLPRLPRSTFRYWPKRTLLQVAGQPLTAAEGAWLRASLAPEAAHRVSEETPMRCLHGIVAEKALTVVFTPLVPSAGQDAPVEGFLVDREALGAAFGEVLAAGSLLPSSLGEGDVAGDDLSIRVLDSAGATLFESGERAHLDEASVAASYAPQLWAKRPFDDAYSAMLEGSEVWVAIDPAAAPKLVIGGLPRSRLVIDDEGPGAPQRERQRVWESFRRLDRDLENGAVAGTGIGLAVVRDLVQRHGGRAWIEEGSRGGARFVLEFPCLPLVGPSAVELDSDLRPESAR
jgi:hypothetical protein